jgi:hypothetical protein
VYPKCIVLIQLCVSAMHCVNSNLCIHNVMWLYNYIYPKRTLKFNSVYPCIMQNITYTRSHNVISVEFNYLSVNEFANLKRWIITHTPPFHKNHSVFQIHGFLETANIANISPLHSTYTVNQLLFASEKFSRGLWDSHCREYFSSRTRCIM